MRSKVLLAVCIGIGSLAVANAAYAGVYNINYNLNLPIAQAAGHTAYQVKTYTGHGTSRDGGTGMVSVQAVGSNYKVDVRMCSIGGLHCGGVKVYGLDDRTSAYQYNNYLAGTKNMVGQLRIASPNVVKVQVQGTYRTDGG